MSVGQVHQLEPQSCPTCSHDLSFACRPGSEKAPSEGDFMICLKCTSILRYGPGLKLRRTAPEEIPVQLRYPLARARHAAQCARAYRN